MGSIQLVYDMNLDGKKVMITGASPDFGRTLAICLYEMGAEVFLVARTMDKAKTTVREMEEIFQGKLPSAHSFGLDFRHPDEFRAFSDKLSQETQSIDILINNAAHWLEGAFLAVDELEIKETVDSILTGNILMAKYLFPYLKESVEPVILNIASLSAEYNTLEPAHEAYSAAKYSVGRFADTLRGRAKGAGLRLITIFPPKFINTRPDEGEDWNRAREGIDAQYSTARNVFESILFSLSQDSLCSIDEIHISNSSE